MNASTFVYGSEVQGNGEIVAFNVALSAVMFTLALVGLILDVSNLFFIKRLKIFHTAFGWFWSSRVISDAFLAILNLVYIAPTVLLQPNNTPVFVSVVAYTIYIVCGVNGCLMHAVIAVNRLVAVYMPIDYSKIFRNSNCAIIISFTAISCLICVPVFIAVPCNLVGFSPRLYEYVFISCAPEVDRDYSIVISAANYFCGFLCFNTVIVDCCTFGRIVYIRKVVKIGADCKTFQRNVRFFKQSAFQNISMVMAAVFLIHTNSSSSPEKTTANIIAITSLMLTHVTNPLSLLIFNPEVRRRLTLKASVWTTESRNSSNLR